MISKVSLENKTGFKLKITYDEKIYNLECTERIQIPIGSCEPKFLKVSIDEDYCFDKVMFGSLKSEIPTLDRTTSICYFTKFDMLFYDSDIVMHKIEIKQHIRRFEYDVIFALLTLDANIPVKYGFCEEKQKIKFTIFNLLNYILTESFYLFLGCAGVVALFSEFDYFNVIFGLIASIVGFIVFVMSTKKRYKLINFNKYFKDILLFDSVPCLPLKIRKRTIIFDDEE